jgi:hypothetical protein
MMKIFTYAEIQLQLKLEVFIYVKAPVLPTNKNTRTEPVINVIIRDAGI